MECERGSEGGRSEGVCESDDDDSMTPLESSGVGGLKIRRSNHQQ